MRLDSNFVNLPSGKDRACPQNWLLMSTLGLDTVKPIAGLPLDVRNSENANLATELHKNQGVGETREQSPPDIEIRRHIKKTGKRGRSRGAQHQGAFELIEEFRRQPCLAGFVPGGRISQLPDRFGCESNGLHLWARRSVTWASA